MHKRSWAAAAAAATLALGGLAACGSDDEESSSGSTTGGDTAQNVSGKVAIDGSSTVGPFAQAAVEQFKGENPDVDIPVGQSGTGGGFEKFCAGETDISNASRPIEDDETELCRKNGITPTEIQVANDGIAIATNPGLEIKDMTVAQLKKLWQNSSVKKYSDIDPSFPDTDVSLFGPGTDSGTFDFFTEEVNGEEGKTRKDYQPSEDDNVLVQGVTGDQGGLGYFGFSYYEQNADKLNLVSIDGVAPSKETIQDGSYKPLSRPIFMYVSDKAIKKPQVKAFMDFVIANQATIAENSQIVPMTDEQAKKAQDELTKAES